MSKILRCYQNFLYKFPILSQAVQTGFLMGVGDLIAQTYVEKKSAQKIDLVRTGQFVTIGTVFVGPTLRIWYGALDKYFGSTGKASTAFKKVAFDQCFLAPIFIFTFMVVVNAVQGSSIKEMKKRIKSDYPDVLKANYKLWPAVQLFNFYIMPLQFQVLTVQAVAIFWNTYLSWKMNESYEKNLKER